MAKSVVAELLLDHALSVAKRLRCAEVSHLHLVAAVRRWQEDMFDAHFPGVASQLNERLDAAKGTSVTTPLVPQTIELELEKIRTMNSLWEYIEELIHQFELTPASFHTDFTSLLSSEELSHEMSAANQARDDFPFAITISLLLRVAEFLGERTVVERVAGDLWWISRQVTIVESAEVLQGIADGLDVSTSDVPSFSELSDLIKTINSSQKEDSNRLASELAVAYGNHAEWSALVDDRRTSEAEVQRVDDLKDRLLEQIDNNVHPEVLAIPAFDSHFGDLVGMEDVKKQIRMFIDTLVFNLRRAKRGLPFEPQRMHMAFLGNPGTGKTTVARRYGAVLRELGLVRGSFREVDASTFTGTVWVGQSEEKMQEVLRESIDGVLFIDEAYGLNDKLGAYDDRRDGPGLRATNLLVKFMEDNHDRLCVILSGYTNLTLEYISQNPGMASRIGCYLYFDDLSEEQVIPLITHIAARKNLELAEGTTPKIAAVIESKRQSKSFGNVRTIEKVLEAAHRKCIARCAQHGSLASEKRLRTIVPEDVEEPPPSVSTPETRRPGYL